MVLVSWLAGPAESAHCQGIELAIPDVIEWGSGLGRLVSEADVGRTEEAYRCRYLRGQIKSWALEAFQGATKNGSRIITDAKRTDKSGN